LRRSEVLPAEDNTRARRTLPHAAHTARADGSLTVHDVLIRDGLVWHDGRLQPADVVIDGERISGVPARPATTSARQVIDADGLAILPGMIDMHVHTRDPGYTHKEDFLTATRAAAAGGVTTIVDMPSVDPPTSTLETFLAKRALAARRCVVDWGHFAAGTDVREIPRLAEAGATGFKILQMRGDPRLCIESDGQLYDAFEAIAATGRLCVVHPGNPAMFDALSQRAWAAGAGRDHVALCRVLADELPWRAGVGTLVVLQERTGVRLHVAHCHAPSVIRLVREAKAAGRAVSAECDLRFFQFRARDVLERGPWFTPGGFVLEEPGRGEAIWSAIGDSTIDAITTDHAPHLREEVERQRVDAWAAPWGNPQLEHAVPALLTDVAAGRLSLAALVRAIAESPARLLGLYPDKGVLRAGSHADLMLVDLQARWTITNEGLQTKCGWTPYEGRVLTGRVEATMLRGRLIMQAGQILAAPGTGAYIRAAART
jgi:dihydroorotase (multifunctional complex type)